jgi:hypothetical protein
MSINLQNQTKYCNKCYVKLDDENWPEYIRKTKTYCCRACKLKYTREWKLANPDSWKRSTYGITQEEYLTLLDKQKDSCAICKTTKAGGKNNVWQIDHCHVSGKVRVLLCWACNAGLGQFRDNTESLQQAINYLKAINEN